MINLYWPVYKNIEREIVELSNQVHFDDSQLTVYSVKISELLIRCVVEIEAIAKELYFKNGGVCPADRDLYFDTDCLNLLEQKWQLSKKKVIISSSNFYFQNVDNKVLNPLLKTNKRGSSAADWKKAYQAVKHNRTDNLRKGNIKNLLKAMAALFLLNLYYRDDKYSLKNYNETSFTENISDLFNIKVHTWHGDGVGENSYFKKEDFDECTYLIKWEDDYKKKWDEFIREQEKILNEIIFNHPNVSQYVNEKFIDNGMIKKEEFVSFVKNREYFKCFDMKTEYGNMINTAFQKASKKLNFDWKSLRTYEAILNKHQKIYSNNEVTIE